MRRLVRILAPITAVVTLVLLMPGVAAAGPATRGFMLDARNFALVAFDPVTNTITDRVPVGTNPTNHSVRPDGREVYVTDYWNDQVQVISTATMAVTATIAVPNPTNFAFTPDSARVYVPNDQADTVSVIDTATRRITATIPVPRTPRGQPAVSPDGARLYVGLQPSSGGAVTVISTATNKVVKTITSLRNVSPSLIRVSPNGRYVLVNGGSVIDASTDTVLPVNLDVMADFAFKDNTTAYLAYTCVDVARGALRLTDITTGQVLRTVIAGRNPSGVALAPDNSRLYAVVDWGRAVVQLDPATDRIVDTFGSAAAGSGTEMRRPILSGTAPASPPGQRFAPETPTNHCSI